MRIRIRSRVYFGSSYVLVVHGQMRTTLVTNDVYGMISR